MKEKILLKSLELFAKKGFDAVSVSMISDGLGISKGALYKHYDSKKAIFDAIIMRMEENDKNISLSFDMPEDSFENMPDRYRNSKLQDLFAIQITRTRITPGMALMSEMALSSTSLPTSTMV